jgi:hypothetical protein
LLKLRTCLNLKSSNLKTVQTWKSFKFENRLNLKFIQNISNAKILSKCLNSKMFKFENRSNLKTVQIWNLFKYLKCENIEIRKWSDSKFVQIFKKFRFKICSYSAKHKWNSRRKKTERDWPSTPAWVCGESTGTDQLAVHSTSRRSWEVWFKPEVWLMGRECQPSLCVLPARLNITKRFFFTFSFLVKCLVEYASVFLWRMD